MENKTIITVVLVAVIAVLLGSIFFIYGRMDATEKVISTMITNQNILDENLDTLRSNIRQNDIRITTVAFGLWKAGLETEELQMIDDYFADVNYTLSRCFNEDTIESIGFGKKHFIFYTDELSMMYDLNKGYFEAKCYYTEDGATYKSIDCSGVCYIHEHDNGS